MYSYIGRVGGQTERRGKEGKRKRERGRPRITQPTKQSQRKREGRKAQEKTGGGKWTTISSKKENAQTTSTTTATAAVGKRKEISRSRSKLRGRVRRLFVLYTCHISFHVYSSKFYPLSYHNTSLPSLPPSSLAATHTNPKSSLGQPPPHPLNLLLYLPHLLP